MEDRKPLKTKELVLGLISIAIIAGIFLAPKKPIQDKRDMARDAFSSCRSAGNKENCYAKYFEQLTENTSRDYAFDTLRALQEIDQQARGCHFIAHAISSAETRKDPSKWRELMNSAPPDCSYGGAHGVLEVHASTYPDGKLPKEIISTVCDNPDHNNCTHGLGHLLLVLNDNDIPESLKDCERLPHDERGVFECLTGVFMERITAVNLELHGLAGKEALNWPARVPELEKLCGEQEGVNAVACWKEIVHAVLIKVRNDPQELVNFCERAPGEEEWGERSTRECIDHALGIMAAGYNFELSRMHPICNVRVKAEDYKNRCYAHLVSSTLSTVPQELPSAKKFCSALEERYQKNCFDMIENMIQFRARQFNN